MASLLCPVCTDPLDSPKAVTATLSPCNHSFCLCCIGTWARASQSQSQSQSQSLAQDLPCPLCTTPAGAFTLAGEQYSMATLELAMDPASADVSDATVRLRALLVDLDWKWPGLASPSVRLGEEKAEAAAAAPVDLMGLDHSYFAEEIARLLAGVHKELAKVRRAGKPFGPARILRFPSVWQQDNYDALLTMVEVLESIATELDAGVPGFDPNALLATLYDYEDQLILLQTSPTSALAAHGRDPATADGGSWSKLISADDVADDPYYFDDDPYDAYDAGYDAYPHHHSEFHKY